MAGRVSPLYFYADRPLGLPVKDPDVMERILNGREAAAILTDTGTLATLQERLGETPRVLAASGDLVLLAPAPE